MSDIELAQKYNQQPTDNIQTLTNQMQIYIENIHNHNRKDKARQPNTF